MSEFYKIFNEAIRSRSGYGIMNDSKLLKGAIARADERKEPVQVKDIVDEADRLYPHNQQYQQKVVPAAFRRLIEIVGGYKIEREGTNQFAYRFKQPMGKLITADGKNLFYCENPAFGGALYKSAYFRETSDLRSFNQYQIFFTSKEKCPELEVPVRASKQERFVKQIEESIRVRQKNIAGAIEEKTRKIEELEAKKREIQKSFRSKNRRRGGYNKEQWEAESRVFFEQSDLRFEISRLRNVLQDLEDNMKIYLKSY